MTRQQRRPLVGFIPAILSLLVFILILFVILGGIGGRLSGLYYLKTDITDLGVPSKLQNSTFLQDLSIFSGADYVGDAATASSLGLASSYTISLLTSCGHFPDGAISCTTPHFGFYFDPVADLKLDGTALSGTFSQDFLNTISSYGKVNRFLAIAYVASAMLSFVAPLMAFCSAALAVVASGIATVLLFAGSIASVVCYRKVNAAFNAAFNFDGMTSKTGSYPVALSFVAFSLSVCASILFLTHARTAAVSARRAKASVIARSVGGKAGESLLGGEDGHEGTRGIVSGTDAKTQKPGLWGRIPTFSQHKYVQIENKPSLVRTDVTGREQTVLLNSPDGVRQRLDEDWATPDDYSHSKGETGGAPGGGAGIPLVSMGANKQTKDMNTAYEPYSAPK
ncbi:SUR7/PalI family-domain-containing protein [Lasiosphaeris hirsuta]|uniref:SUR7/PalI family-domain-containing protein n=1 Tax=Lasiosphaeris hirsuta TaxID=260670 RepID=A0AA40DVP6_9PEZI|nr:SUR7/PalI family-domain-containing protein [Lasiosphaeris hirsuta]